ncbi:hypothetical protein BDV95DRAFT_607118 [Massariosphaeria phaeospora]|uniref:Uncharacterized protein n=1 Tax=Massariosphaeria phaeospora TaxID=100035 RepID=A0A7C8MA07_9PLEO|nr:hypothetical protein BDV95DRAFT_607118 [Massariosphaeria phaeospora]
MTDKPDPRPFQFQELPAESRNRVYHHIVEDIISIESIHNKTRFLPSTNSKSCYGHQSAHGYFGLISVCQMTRDEFRPLFLEHTTANIPAYGIAQYIDCFYPSSAVVEMDKLKGRIIVDYETSTDDPAKPLDVLPLLVFNHKAPGVECRFNSEIIALFGKPLFETT